MGNNRKRLWADSCDYGYELVGIPWDFRGKDFFFFFSRKLWRRQIRSILREWSHRRLCKWGAPFLAKFVWWVSSVESVSPLSFLLLSLLLVPSRLVGFHFQPFQYWATIHHGIQAQKSSVSAFLSVSSLLVLRFFGTLFYFLFLNIYWQNLKYKFSGTGKK